jgi:hypothetical protein
VYVHSAGVTACGVIDTGILFSSYIFLIMLVL